MNVVPVAPPRSRPPILRPPKEPPPWRKPLANAKKVGAYEITLTRLMMTMHAGPYLGNEKYDCDYPSEDSLWIIGKPYNVQHDRSTKQRDELDRISIPLDPNDRRSRSLIATIEEHQGAPVPRFQIRRLAGYR
jgi:hypothetical protein